MSDGGAAILLWNRTRSRLVATRVWQARTLWQLTTGLLVRPPLVRQEALWLQPCGSIHTWGMRYAIDVVFLNENGQVLGVKRNVRPWKLALAPRGTHTTLELCAGGAFGVEIGDQLELDSTALR